ncbi:MAG: flagellar basal body-associated FliL family protein [Gammaproteobacteria bacterium]|nr:flagellar basal body-associated FliL family protein [Gammaproteobacteria bacterium]
MRRSSQHLSILFAMVVLAPAASVAAEEQAPTEIAYYALKPSFVSNLSGGPKYIRCDIQLMTEQASEIPKIELHTPALRHDILMLIGGQDGNQLKTREGKEDLRQTALASVRSRLEEMTGKAIVNDLYFTAYYVK